MNYKKLVLLLLVLLPCRLSSADDDLPILLEIPPPIAYDLLSPIGAGKKTVDEAREQLRLEARKVQADAVIHVRCESGGMGRDGWTFYRKDAYCRGMAIRYRSKETSTANSRQKEITGKIY